MPSLSFRNKTCFALPLILFIFSGISLSAQNISTKQKAGEEIFIARIKQFNEFVARFNYKSDFKGNPVDSLFRVKMPREKMIPLLFDMKDLRNQSADLKNSNDFIKTKTDFIREVINNGLLINKYSPGIIAEARSRVLFNGEPRIVRVFLNQEIVENDMVKWTILTVKGDIFYIFKTDTSMVRFIPPSSNETDFINLKRALDDTEHLQNYASSNFEPDYLTLFFYCIKSGLIRYEYVEEVVYHIIDIPGWHLKVKEFNRNELNSGWLITDVAINNLSFSEFLKSL